MGMPFPRGLALAVKAGLPAPPFYWGLNGILSVAGSLGTMVLAVTSGFTVAMLAGCGCYLVAALAGRELERRRGRKPRRLPRQGAAGGRAGGQRSRRMRRGGR